MQKFAVLVTTDSDRAIDNGRMTHVLSLAAGLVEKGADVKVVFGGRAVTWLPKFAAEGKGNKFTDHYGPKFEKIRDVISACNMCAKRFEVHEEIGELGFPIVGDGQGHHDMVNLALEGRQIISL